MKFSEKKFDYASVYLEETDKALPEKINIHTRYAYFKTIAKGGKCLIQSCKDLHLSRVICYKSLLPEFADDPIEQQRFLREARVSAMLQHPNTVPTYELGRDNKGHYYFTMKLVHGYTLREILDYRERYDLSQLVDVIIQVAHALEYAHAHGVIHRDIKPENILVGPFGEVALMDWGLAKVWKTDGTDAALPLDKGDTDSDNLSITRKGKLQGTIIHMSPEQIDKDPNIDGRTDIYSLGTILYEILTAQTPSSGKTMDQIIDDIKHHEPTLPSAASQFKVPPLLERAAMACLKKKPDERIQTANELIRLLQEASL
ncbi:MAG: protein kinase [SAR86 cluster bacterium]|uniref:Protein kinase n=1 Tax=SAR86 cluster bacterium TaxID=2030880 RepID=A0A2A5CDA7_9GAMM|nr:serine/threonine protein kinase [Gammaproteobacteria bacterium AH-315-E17]PCJ41518.1 MAG: protein kinase [SAR86 cluster bacterium]